MKEVRDDIRGLRDDVGEIFQWLPPSPVDGRSPLQLNNSISWGTGSLTIRMPSRGPQISPRRFSSRSRAWRITRLTNTPETMSAGLTKLGRERSRPLPMSSG